MEVIPTVQYPRKWKHGILHVCGGDPLISAHKFTLAVYSPRMWRWSRTHNFFIISSDVFSTYVEVIPSIPVNLLNVMGILHVCGGDPWCGLNVDGNIRYSPRMWRWSRQEQINGKPLPVFSTYVEVILRWSRNDWPCSGILHVCGGDPKYGVVPCNETMYSPRMWRWSSTNLREKINEKVFSTYVEVIPWTCSKL